MIDDRIQAIINFADKNSRVADIGADHGYLSIELAKRNISNFVIASDKNFGPVQAAKKNISDAGFENVIDVRIGDGLKVLKENEVDTICIAGMGGNLICEILNDSPEILQSTKKLILQPMNAVEKVLRWIDENNFFTADIDLAEVGGIIYEIICAVKNSDEISAIYKKEKSPLLKTFLEQRLNKLQRVKFEMMKSSSAITSEKYLQIQNQIDELEFEIKKIR